MNDVTKVERDKINDPRPGDFIPVPSLGQKNPAHRIKLLHRDGDALKVQVKAEVHNWTLKTWKQRWTKAQRDILSEAERESIGALA